MDDFLHNLRSGKLKQSDRQNRPYGDPQYKGGPRRNMMDRRKREADHKDSSDRLNAVKEVLEGLAETHKRMTDAYLERNRIEARKAAAMEMLAKNLYRMLNPHAKDTDGLFASAGREQEPAERQNAGKPAPAESETAPPPAEENSAEMAEQEACATTADPSEPGDEKKTSASGRLTELDRHTLFAVINQMRSEGNNWESIARHIAGKGYPTLSGKGVWRGGMVKSLYEKMAAVQG